MHELRYVLWIHTVREHEVRAEIIHMITGSCAFRPPSVSKQCTDSPIGCARMLSAEGGLADDLRGNSGFIHL